MHKALPILVLAACAMPCDDNGRLERDGVDLYQSVLPIAVMCHGIDCRGALAWWGAEYVVERPGGSLIEHCWVPPGAGGSADVLYTHTGMIIRGKICIEDALKGHWSEPRVIAHEIGHVLGLDDDPQGCPSVMSQGRLRLLEDAVLTDHDRRVLETR